MADSSTLVDRVKIFVESSGTGPFQLGNALPSFRGSEALVDGLTYSYAVENGSDYEVGQGVYVLAVDQLIRAPTLSSNGGAPVSFPANVAVNFTALAADLVAGLAGSGTVTSVQGSGGTTGLTFTGGPITGAGTLTLGGTLGLANGGTSGTDGPTARTALGLGNVDNTSDANKPVSTATQTALNAKVAFTDLAAAGGANLVKTSRDNTVNAELTWTRAAGPASINEFYDASNGAAADRMALEAALASGRAVSWRGTLTLDQAVTMPDGTTLEGEGGSYDKTVNGKSMLVRGFTGSGPLLIMGDNCILRNLDVNGDYQGTGDNVKIMGERVVIDNVSSRKAGQDNFRLGDDNNDTLNANGWRFLGIRSYGATRRGLFIHHTNSNTDVTFPQGPPDVNLGVMLGGESKEDGENGLVIGNAIDNVFVGVGIQHSVGRNLNLLQYARGHKLYGTYSEAGGSSDQIEIGAVGNILEYGQSLAASPIVDLNPVGANDIRAYVAALARYAARNMSLCGEFGGSVATLDMYAPSLDLAAQTYGEATGTGSQGKGVATAKRNGNTPAAVFEWAPDGIGINILTGALRVSGTQVVGARGAAVADATDAASAITQLNALLARCRAHGLIS